MPKNLSDCDIFTLQGHPEYPQSRIVETSKLRYGEGVISEEIYKKVVENAEMKPDVEYLVALMREFIFSK